MTDGAVIGMFALLLGFIISELEAQVDALQLENERLKGLLREYRQEHIRAGLEHRCAVDPLRPDYRCDLCKRTDQELQSTQGGQG
jgi:hypothetical protein